MYSKSEYIQVTESVLDQLVLTSRKLVVLEFGADWCGNCMIMNPIIDDLIMLYKDKILLIKLDIKKNQKLVRKFGIQARPTFLFIRNGNIVDTAVHLISTMALHRKIKFLLDNES